MNRRTFFVPCVLAVLSLSAFAGAQDRGPSTPPTDNTRQGPPPGDRPDGLPPPRDDNGGPGPNDRDQRPPRVDNGGPGQNDRDQRPPRDDNGGPGPNDRDQRPPRPDQQNGGGRQQSPQGAPAGGTNDVMRYQGYLSMVAQYSKMAGDPESAGVAAVVSAADVLRRGGPQEAINYFTKLLPEVKIDAVRRAIRLQLVDLYKAVKQDDKALEQLHVLITADAVDSPGKK